MREAGVLVSSDERLDVGAGGEQGGIELSVSSDLVHPRSHQSDGRTDVAAVVSTLLVAVAPVGSPSLGDRGKNLLPDRSPGDALVDAANLRKGLG